MSDETPPPPPASLPNYLADGLPKQDLETLVDTREYVEELIEWSRQPVDADEIPGEGESVDDPDGESGRGTVVKEKVKCGDETCHCADGERHGPYLYRYFRKGGKLTSEYVGKP